MFLGREMEISKILVISSALLLLCASPICAKTTKAPTPSPTPAPAPAPGPDYVNLTNLLGVAGPFQTFLGYLESTKVIHTFQNQANNSHEGITIFVPKDGAFSSQKKPSLSNLTKDQLKSLILFHALPHYYSLADFKNLSQTGPVSTFAGGRYTLNITDVSGTVHINSGWTDTKVSSSVHSTDPVAIYQVDKILLPTAIFGTDLPPAPAPVPAPETSPAPDDADAPSADSRSTPSPDSKNSREHSSSCRTTGWGILCYTALAFCWLAGLVLVRK